MGQPTGPTGTERVCYCLFATFSPNYMGVGGLVARNSCFSEAGFVAKIFGWVRPVAKPFAKKNWAPSILSPDIAKVQTLK